jgi:tetratricopeptide (TPR) repeat protein
MISEQEARDRAIRRQHDREVLAFAEQRAMRDPKDGWTQLTIARCLEQQGRFVEALEHGWRALELADSAVARSTARNRCEELIAREQARRRAAAIAESGPAALRAAADELRIAMRDLFEEVELRRLAAEDATTRNLNALGGVLRDSGDFGEALAVYERSLARDASTRGNAAAYTGRAAVLRDLRRWSESIESYERVLAERPDDQFALAGIAAVARDAFEHEHDPAAKQRYEEALSRLEPSNAAKIAGRRLRVAVESHGTRS